MEHCILSNEEPQGRVGEAGELIEPFHCFIGITPSGTYFAEHLPDRTTAVLGIGICGMNGCRHQTGSKCIGYESAGFNEGDLGTTRLFPR